MRKIVLLLVTALAVSACNSTDRPAEQSATTQPVAQTDTRPEPELTRDGAYNYVGDAPQTPAVTTTPVHKTIPVKRRKELNNVVAAYAAPSKFFTVPANRVSKLKGDKGTVIELDPAKLENEDGSPVTGPIKVELKELVNPADLIFNNAPTCSNGELLVSGGSYYINATNNGKAMRIKTGQALKVQVPQVKESEMELFYGNANAAGTVNWQVSNDAISNKPVAKAEPKKQVVERAPAEGGAQIFPANDFAVAESRFNCFNIWIDENNYAVITVGNTVKIAKMAKNKQVKYIINDVFPAGTLCVSNYNEKDFRTYKADTLRKNNVIEYTVKSPAKTDAVDVELLGALKHTEIKVPANALITKIVTDADLRAENEKRMKDNLVKQVGDVKRIDVDNNVGNIGWPKGNEANMGNEGGYWSTANWGNKNDLNHYNANDQTNRNKAADTTYKKAFSTMASTLTVSKMGWINIDRFYNEKQRQDLVVQYDGKEFDGINTVLVFKDIFTVINSNYSEPENGIAGFKNMPAKKDVTLIAYTTKNNKIYAQVRDANTANGTVTLDLQPVTDADFKNMIAANVK